MQVSDAAYTVWRLMSLRGSKVDGTILRFRKPFFYTYSVGDAQTAWK